VVGDHGHVFLLAARGLRRRRIPRGSAALRRLPHGDDHVSGDDEVDLLIEDPLLGGGQHRDEQLAEDVVAVRLELRAGLVVVECRGEELLQRSLVHVGRQVRLQLVPAGVEQVDPAGTRGHCGNATAALGWN